jgi:hypothetical protein
MRKEKAQMVLSIVEAGFFIVLVAAYHFLWPVLLFVALSHIPAKVLKK